MLMSTTTIGIIGCGNISDAYLKGAGRFDIIAVKAVAGRARGGGFSLMREFGGRAG